MKQTKHALNKQTNQSNQIKQTSKSIMTQTNQSLIKKINHETATTIMKQQNQ